MDEIGKDAFFAEADSTDTSISYLRHTVVRKESCKPETVRTYESVALSILWKRTSCIYLQALENI